MLKVTVTFYEYRKTGNQTDFSRPDYGNPHTYEITGTAAECMREFLTGEKAMNHNLAKYTPRHITYIEEI